MSKETLCTNCSHRNVCSLKEKYIAAQETVDNILISISDGETVYLRDIPWIKPVELSCKEFQKPQITPRGGFA